MSCKRGRKAKTQSNEDCVGSSAIATKAAKHNKANNNLQPCASKRGAISDMVTRSNTCKRMLDAAGAAATRSRRSGESDCETGAVNGELSPKIAAPAHRRTQKPLKAVKAEPPLVENDCSNNFENTLTSSSKVFRWLSSTKDEPGTVGVSSVKTVAKPLQPGVNIVDGGEGKRRRRLRAFSKHWLDYPKVIIGVIDEVTDQCNEVELKARLQGALNHHLIGRKSFSCCVDEYEVGSTILRRYVNMAKSMLEQAMGTDELPAEVHAFLTPDTEFLALKSHINLNVAHCKRKTSEQSDDEPLAKIQRGRMDAEKRVKLGKKVIKSKKISVSGSNTGDGESLQQQMISLSEQSLHTQGTTKLSNSSFFPHAKTGVNRQLFCGTISDLRAKVLKILEGGMEYHEDIEQLVDITTSAIVKEVSLRDRMDRAGLSLKMLLSAYALCGRFIALDQLELVDNSDQVMGASASTATVDASTLTVFPLDLQANVGVGKENCPVNSSGEKTTKSAGYENSLMGELCGKLVDAFAMGRSDDGDFTRLKCAIDYMVQYGYKRSEDDKKQLRDLLEAVLIDGISVQSAMDESPGFKRVIVTEYWKRCQQICTYLSSGELDFADENTVAKKVESFTKTLFS